MIAFDSSALIKRYQREDHSDWVREQMSRDPEWCGSTLLATETAIAIARLIPDSESLGLADIRVSRDLEFFDLFPVDGEVLVGAVELGRAFGLRTLDAIHLSSFRSIPTEFRVMTFDGRLAAAAKEIGLDLLAPPGA